MTDNERCIQLLEESLEQGKKLTASQSRVKELEERNGKLVDTLKNNVGCSCHDGDGLCNDENGCSLKAVDKALSENSKPSGEKERVPVCECKSCQENFGIPKPEVKGEDNAKGKV